MLFVKKEGLFIYNLKSKKLLNILLSILLITSLLLGFGFFSKTDISVSGISRDEIELIPGGEAIGINLNTGVYVASLYSVRGSGSYHSPAKNAGLKAGDVILKVNDNDISSIADVKKVINTFSKTRISYFTVKYSRNGNDFITKLYPIKNDRRISTGMYLKDKVVGVGTLTFIFPNEKIFGALGHEIGNNNSDSIDGEITNASITSIRKGSKGNPGEKKADIAMDEVIGKINSNKTTGIYGEYDNSLNKEKLKVAAQNEVELGEAWIYTVIDGDKVDKFKVDIVDLKTQTRNSVKGIKLRVVDKRLLDKTGGIIQGMSGSPIIQNNKIVGAVTHVLLEDSALGYGIYIDWMLEDAGIIIN